MLWTSDFDPWEIRTVVASVDAQGLFATWRIEYVVDEHKSTIDHPIGK